MATTTNFGWSTPDDTDLVKDGALAIRTLGSAIDTSLVDLKGGTTGQVLSKNSNTDMDFTWVTSDDADAIQNSIVDAKGDLISATADNTPARLAVGNNGETLLADSSTSTGLRYNPQPVLANPVINGGFDIWQRGTSIAATAAYFYNADRWLFVRGGFATGATISRQTTSDTTNLPNIQYAARVQRNSGNTSTAYLELSQTIETANSLPFVGKTVTLSFYARRGANYSEANNALVASFVYGTGTDQSVQNFTSLTSIASSVVGLTTTWQRFVINATIATAATELAMLFAYTPTGTASTNDYFEITGVQLDLGTYTASSAPAFRRSGGTLAGELAACQRYYWRTTPGTNSAVSTYGMAFTTTGVLIPIQNPVTMRVSATSIDYSTLQAGDGQNAFLTVTSATLYDASPQISVASLAVTGATQYRSYFARGTYIGFSAEL